MTCLSYIVLVLVDTSVGIGASIMRLGQISFFFSFNTFCIVLFNLVYTFANIICYAYPSMLLEWHLFWFFFSLIANVHHNVVVSVCATMHRITITKTSNSTSAFALGLHTLFNKENIIVWCLSYSYPNYSEAQEEITKMWWTFAESRTS